MWYNNKKQGWRISKKTKIIAIVLSLIVLSAVIMFCYLKFIPIKAEEYWLKGIYADYKNNNLEVVVRRYGENNFVYYRKNISECNEFEKYILYTNSTDGIKIKVSSYRLGADSWELVMGVE